jgi:flagellar protein FliT
MTGNEAIACYERILAIMEQMREAASRSEWDRLVELEIGCKAVVTVLEGQQTAEPLSAPLQQRKAAIIRQVLALDAAIRDMTEPWLQHLQAFLGSRQQERKLYQAYGTPDAAR